jgi:hypothetical protein
LCTYKFKNAMAALQKEEKERFFSALYQLDQLSDDEVALTPTPKLLQQPPAVKIAPEAVPVPRGFTPGIAAETEPLRRHVASTTITKVSAPQKSTTQRRPPATARPPLPFFSSKPNKRKKIAKFEVIPEAKRIFTGSTFYFIPNNDVAAPRKLRIQRALQYGAVWERVFSARVTHVVVDSNITMTDVLKHFRVEELPVSILPVQR